MNPRRRNITIQPFEKIFLEGLAAYDDAGMGVYITAPYTEASWEYPIWAAGFEYGKRCDELPGIFVGPLLWGPKDRSLPTSLLSDGTRQMITRIHMSHAATMNQLILNVLEGAKHE